MSATQGRLTAVLSDRYRIERELGAGGIDSRGLAVAALSGTGALASLESSQASNLVLANASGATPPPDLSPDGTRLLVLKGQRQRILTVHDWGAEVRTKLAGRGPN